MKRALLPAIFLFGLATSLQAQLTFEATTLERTVSVAESRVPVVFKFKNTGDRKVKIERIDTSCGCLKANSDKKFYDPGESGTIEATFSMTGQEGLHQKQIDIQTNMKGQRQFPLTVRILATGIVHIEPKMVVWKVGEAPEPKRVTIKIDDGYGPMPIKEVSSTRSNVGTKVYAIEPGKHYEVEVTPEDTSAKLLGALKIELDTKISAQEKQMVIYRVEG